MKAKPRNSPMPATSAPALHDQDFHTWTTGTARAIREGRFDAVDWESVAEELEGIGRSEQRELESRLGVLLAHLLKWRYRPETDPAANRSWTLTIEEQRQRTRRLLKQSPGLKRMLEETFAEAYGDARLQAARDCRVDKNAFPDTCPWIFDQTMDDGFWLGQ
jgi:hypothetical protein